MARVPRVFRLQCPDVSCCWSITFAVDGHCFCGCRLVMVPNYEVIDRIANGEYSEEQMDTMAMFLSAAMRHRR